MQAAKHRVEEEEEEEEKKQTIIQRVVLIAKTTCSHSWAQNVLSRDNNEEISDLTLSHQQVGQTACRRRS